MIHPELPGDIDSLVSAFENAVHDRGTLPCLEEFLPPPNHRYRARGVRELVCIDIEFRWSLGKPVVLEEYLRRYPELSEADALSDICFEEYRQRRGTNSPATPAEYRERFGIDTSGWPSDDEILPNDSNAGEKTNVAAEKTQVFQVETGKALAGLTSEKNSGSRKSGTGKTGEMPSVGQEFLGFRIVDELGRGAFGRVFLAEQVDLSNRPVALKVSTELIRETRKLARLQHANIVPVYSVHRSDNLQALAMPFLGGITLSDVLKRLMRTIVDPLSGSEITKSLIADDTAKGTLKTARHPSTGSGPLGSSGEPMPGLLRLGSMNFIDAVLWMAARLADALAHAHERGIVHRDIKPANILLTEDGQPMLLDFNLADDSNEERAAERAKVGGTVPYMSPEQLRAYGGNPGPIDGRSDLFSLGIVMYQLIARRMPYVMHLGSTREIFRNTLAERELPIRKLSDFHPLVTPAVDAIVAKCLAPNVEDRYRSASELCEDIERHRVHLPLKYARETSPLELARKWIRRHPRLTSPASLCAIVAAVMLSVTALAVRLSLDARAARQDRDRAVALEEFHALLADSSRVKQLLHGDSRQIAQGMIRGQLLLESNFGPDALPPVERERLRLEIGELAFLVARAAIVRGVDAERSANANDLAAKLLGPEFAALTAIQKAELRGDPADFPSLNATVKRVVANGGRASFLWACDLAARGRHREALPLANGFALENPEDFDAWYLKARCHDRLDEYENALGSYAVCISLRPGFARAYQARAEMAFRTRRDLHQAKADLDRALKLEPDAADARFSRALVCQSLNLHSEAIADLVLLESVADAPSRIWFVRAISKEALNDAAGAKADRETGASVVPADPASWVSRGFARMERDPKGALADFVAAEQLDPRYPEALVNQAFVLGEKLGRFEDAIAAVDRLLKWNPDNLNGRCGRAVLLARVGRTTEAVEEARRCLAGANQPSSIYQAACVFAVASERDPSLREEATRLLAESILKGFGYEFIKDDADLNPLRKDPKFQRLLDGVKAILETSAKPKVR